MSQKILTMMVLPSCKQLLKSSILNTSSQTPSLQAFQGLSLSRSLATKSLSPTVTLITNDSSDLKHLRNRPDLSNYSSEGRPLSILLCWLMSKNNAVKKYAQFYLDQGFDVLTIRVSPWQLLLPQRIEPIVLNEIIPALITSDHEKKLIHGFSVGGYVFARILKHMQQNPDCDDLLKTIKGQIWDSVVDVNGVSIGVSKSVFTTSPFFQQAMQNYIDFHMKAFYNIATKYYFDAHETFYYNPLKAPALFFSSEIDQISTIDVIQEVQKEWAQRGIECSNKIWANTTHVGHMKAYPDEYKDTLKSFLDKKGMKPSRRIVTDRVAQRNVIPNEYPNVVYNKAF